MNLLVKLIVRKPPRGRRRCLLDIDRCGPLRHGAPSFRVGEDEINSLVLRAEGRGTILRGQLIVKLDYIG